MRIIRKEKLEREREAQLREQEAQDQNEEAEMAMVDNDEIGLLRGQIKREELKRQLFTALEEEGIH